MSQSLSSPIQASAEEHTSVFPQKFSSLIGLKFFLILAVVFNHGRIFFDSWQQIKCPCNLSLAVSGFFVLSGFLLNCGKNIPLERNSIFIFYAKRVARIWPGHIFSLILLVVLLPVTFPIDLSHLDTFLANIFLVQAWIPQSRYFFSYNSPSWSMSTLFFFYLCFPFLSVAVRSRFGFLLLPISICMVLAVAWLSHHYNLPDYAYASPCVKGLMYISPLTRIVEFIAGLLACEVLKKWIGDWRPKILMATAFEITAIFLLIWVSTRTDAWTFAVCQTVSFNLAMWLQYCGFSLIPILLLILALSFQSGLVSKFLSTKRIVHLGEISFGIYLLHMVFFQYLHYKFPNSTSPAASALILAMLIVSAHLMHTFLEKPLRNLTLKMR